MQVQLTCRGFTSSGPTRHHIETRAAKLLEHDDHVVALKVALELPPHHHQHGSAYRVRIEMIVPGGDLVISQRDGEEGHTELGAAIDDAFRAAERRLREHTRVRRGDVKFHASGWRASHSA